MRSISIKGSSSKEIKIALEQSMADGFRPTLAMVFISIRQRVSDNGYGIPQAIIDKISQPFFTTEPTRQGIVLF